MTERSIEQGRMILRRFMKTRVQFQSVLDDSVILETWCRYQPITMGTQRATSSEVLLYRDVRLQCPWDTDTSLLVPDNRFVVIESANEQLVGTTGTVTWAQDSDIVLERTVLCKVDVRGRP